MIRRFLVALQFLTIFRVRTDLGEIETDWAGSMGYYPLVGLVLGGTWAGLAAGLGGFPPTLAGLLLVLAMTVLTRGLHLDGLADSADGLLSHRDRARKLAIMKDSRIGTFGVLALFFVLGLKIAAARELLARPEAWKALILTPVWGRWTVTLTACLSPYARAEGGLGRPFVAAAGTKEIIVAGSITTLISILIGGRSGLFLALALTLLAWAGVRLWRRELGGVTGDILGAVIELTETLGLVALAAL